MPPKIAVVFIGFLNIYNIRVIKQELSYYKNYVKYMYRKTLEVDTKGRLK